MGPVSVISKVITSFIGVITPGTQLDLIRPFIGFIGGPFCHSITIGGKGPTFGPLCQEEPMVPPAGRNLWKDLRNLRKDQRHSRRRAVSSLPHNSGPGCFFLACEDLNKKIA